ncbi:TPA: hypothetical protein EYP66_01755 [Candidatus Poribacteria bacterium]|nr:hypothetical protein [Candidatus Poribacteria bacterium]
MYQLSQYQPPQIASGKAIPRGKAVTTPEPLISQPLVDLPSDRNIFKSTWKEEEGSNVVEKTTTTLQKPILSTICWSDELSLAIINGEILAEGDEDSKSQFRVETITRDKVGIRFISGGKYVWLTLGAE